MSVCIVTLAATASFCGGSDKGTTTAPTASATAVTVGIQRHYRARQHGAGDRHGEYEGSGQSQAVATGFLSDTPGVATVTDGGLVTAVSQGRANIYVASAAGKA